MADVTFMLVTPQDELEQAATALRNAELALYSYQLSVLGVPKINIPGEQNSQLETLTARVTALQEEYKRVQPAEEAKS